MEKITKRAIEKAVSTSSKIEGMSLSRAKKNQTAINILKKHGRGFSL